jgi:hypothetical protein
VGLRIVLPQNAPRPLPPLRLRDRQADQDVDGAEVKPLIRRNERTDHPLADAIRFTPKQIRAMELMRKCAGHDDGWAVVCSSGTFTTDGQAWIDWRTAKSLVERDLAEYDEDDLGLVRLWEHAPDE